MGSPDGERLQQTRAFFGVRAATWDAKFGDDLPAYAAAVAEAGLPLGALVADIGCGTGRALPALRAAVGPAGTVLALDATPEMLRVAHGRGTGGQAALILADALHLPLGDRVLGAVFAAGLLMHLPDPVAALTELARVTAESGLLILFHPSGRAALAARHGRKLSDDDTLADAVLGPLLTATGWRLRTYDDAAQRFFAVAERVEAG
jgi:ubiquinone/menaquinone biosynthesis C-methylase UbiE